MNLLDHSDLDNLEQIKTLFINTGCTGVLIKQLGKNNNDKNQIYFHHNPDFLNSIFDLTFGYRTTSTSGKKKGTKKPIPEAVFNHFYWLGTDASMHKVPLFKGILYAQYPEVRLSGFKAESGIMPSCLSVQFTKDHPKAVRFLLIGVDADGKAFGIAMVNPKQSVVDEILTIPLHQDSKICRYLELNNADSGTEKLKYLLSQKIVGKDIKGCRLDKNGQTLPFTGTQVHGYTLEHELGIIPNASKDGDIFGIELKCFTSKKLTLFTPEPDGGLYANDFQAFMLKYGYKKNAVYRFTGLHRANSVNEKSELSMAVWCSPKGNDDELIDFRIDKPFKDQLQNLQVVLIDSDNSIAASWSLARLFNNWGVKHNEVVYIPATVADNTVQEEVSAGFTRRVWFGSEVLWCHKSTLEKMLHAIVNGTIFLDPAPKLDPDNPKNNKRRSQWRINNIYRDAPNLYQKVETVNFVIP